MKKYIYILSALLLSAIACTAEKESVTPEEANMEGKVTYIMKVTLPESIVATRATWTSASEDANMPVLRNIYVATFGTSHYLNDYTRAVRCDENGNNLSQDWSGIVNGQTFYFKVTLVATQSKRTVHVIGNGPDQIDFNAYESEIMTKLTTNDKVGGYWQYFELSNGTANADGSTTDEATAAFSDVRLMRNFAKVNLTVDPKVQNFRLTGFNVYNTPKSGSYAIWKKVKGKTMTDSTVFVTDYASKNFETLLVDADLRNGSLADTTTMDMTEPTTTETYNPSIKYLYERPDRDTDRPYVIIKGFYKEGDTEDAAETYYRLDFVDRDGNYLPILRNFEYTIKLTSVAKRGKTNPQDCVASNSNVSTLTETQNLTDLADGVSRIYVQWLNKAYLNSATMQGFKYMYLKNAATETESSKATFKVLTGSDPSISTSWTDITSTTEFPYAASAISIKSDYGWDNGGTLGSDGWRTVYFDVNTPSTTDQLSTTFRVIGTTDDGQKLYRDITVFVLPEQKFKSVSWVTDGSFSADNANANGVHVTIELPAGLPSSVFPLTIIFEDSARKLNPAGTDMPVTSVSAGESIAGRGSNTYQFEKTISYIEYGKTIADNDYKVTCEFVRISDGPTNLYFTNKYFHTVYIELPANNGEGNTFIVKNTTNP